MDTHKPRAIITFEGGELEDSDSRFVSCSIDDHAGTQNDTVEVVLLNHPYVSYPPMRTEFEIKLGFGANLTTMGVFIIDEVEDSGPPDIIKVRGHAIDTDSLWKEIRFFNYDPKQYKMIADIVRAVVARNGGNAVIDPVFENTNNPYTVQRNQSDQDFLTKLGEFYGAIMKPMMRDIYFIRKGQDSDDAPSFDIYKTQVSNHSYLNQGRSGFGIVVSRWRDVNTGAETAISMQTGLASKAVFVMPKVYSTEVAARGAASAMSDAFMASKETFNFTYSGLPGMVAQSKVRTRGFHPEMPSDWRVLQCSHTLTKGQGYETNAVCEIPKAQGDGNVAGEDPDLTSE